MPEKAVDRIPKASRWYTNVALWTAVLTALFLVISGATSAAAILIPSLISGFLLVPFFIMLMVWIHQYAPTDKKPFTLMGIVFAVIYGGMISFNYFVQLTSVRQGQYVELFSIDNSMSLMWVIEVLGYGFMGLATLAAAVVFRRGKLELSIRWIFILNGALGILGVIGYALQWSMSAMLGGLVVWNIVMPIASALLAVHFLKIERTMIHDSSVTE